MSDIQPLVIGAPFGNYLTREYATSTVGTFTLYKRAGALGRLWRVLRTVRYYPRPGAWINQLGLPNPGIHRVPIGGGHLRDKILSVRGLAPEEWLPLAQVAVYHQPLALEVNLGCPNVATIGADESVRAVEAVMQTYRGHLIAKLPPVRWMDFVRPLWRLGVRHFHLVNTLGTPRGGISGKPLLPLALWAVAEVRQAFGQDVTILGGGGITSAEDVRAFRRAGADRVAVASLLFNPLRWRGLRALAEAAAAPP